MHFLQWILHLMQNDALRSSKSYWTLGAAVAQEVSVGLTTGRLLVRYPGSA